MMSGSRKWSQPITVSSKLSMDTSIARTEKKLRVAWANGEAASSKTWRFGSVTMQHRSKQSWQPYGSQHEGSISSQPNTAWIPQLSSPQPRAME